MEPVTQPGQRHLLNQIVQFSEALHAGGVRVDSARLIDFCRALSFIDIGDKDDFYAAAHATLVSRQVDIPEFDRIFHEFWQLERETHEETTTEEQEIDGEQPESAEHQQWHRNDTTDDGDEPQGTETPVRSYSPNALLRKKDFDEMSDKEIEQARLVLKDLIALLATYTSRRRIASNHGEELNLRRMLKDEALYGRDSIKLRYRKRKTRRTRLLLLCDVSGSMERYSRFVIQFIYAMRQQLAALDVAVFSTKMTVITDHLRRQSVNESLDEVSRMTHDWAGGTDIGHSLAEFNAHFAHDLDRRRTVVIILSDGWDRGNATQMRREMGRLYDRVHKVIWLNPLLGSSDYEPLCRGMQTALPFIDHFMSAHNLESLANLIQLLRTVWRG